MEKLYISVILPLKLDWTPVYLVPEGYGPVRIGMRVRVAFAGRKYTGVVGSVGVSPDVSPSKIKEIDNIRLDIEDITESEIDLWKSISSYYLCTIGEVYKAAYPATVISQEEIEARIRERARAKKEKAEESMRKKEAALEAKLQKRVSSLQKAKKQEVIDRIESEIDGIKSEINLIRGKNSAIGSGNGIIECRNEAIGSGNEAIESATGVPSLSGNIAIESHKEGLPSSGIVLTQEQTEATSSIKSAFSQGKTVFLRGITGSGKTEIYITLAIEAMQRGENVLYLVPEIALSRQLESRLKRVFGTHLLIFHSGESIISRRETSSLIRASRLGCNYIVLGTRSSLFLPHRELGLIIVDEEHDTSYKQDSPAPRYNGRDTAIMLKDIQNRFKDRLNSLKDIQERLNDRQERLNDRQERLSSDARGHRCDIILGSATPSLETLFNCATGKYAEVTLTQRYGLAKDAELEIIDTIAERRKRGMVGSFSKKLIFRINETLEDSGQVMILRARRSYSPALQCEECGHIVKCPHCNVSLNFHKDKGTMQCHHCGYSMPFSGKCPECGGPLKGLGAGTQKIEEEAAALFPNAVIARLDADSAQNRKTDAETIRRFAKGEIDILVGTQILTKGFDFENLSLVAVIQADTLLGIQDFRADERAAQTLIQFRGRCARRNKNGRFVIQTSQPQHPVYRMLEMKEDFNANLLTERKMFGYPPFSRSINIILKDTDLQKVAYMADKLASALGRLDASCGGSLSPQQSSVQTNADSTLSRQHSSVVAAIDGPFAPATDKIADMNIRIIRIMLKKDKRAAAFKAKIYSEIKRFEEIHKYPNHIAIDVDPV